MRAFELLRNPQGSPLKPVYVVHGDDVYLRKESIGAIAKVVFEGDTDDAGIRRFEGASASLADVMDELRTLPFFSKRRLTVVDDAESFVTKTRKELEAYVEAPSSTGFLVLMLKSFPSNTNLYKKVNSAGVVIDCSTPMEKDLIPWLSQLATNHGAKLETDAARLLVELVGAEVGLLASEVEKLSVYVGEKKKIGRADVAKMVEAGRIETIWKVIDAATMGQAAEAVTDLDQLVAGGEHPIKILAALTTSLLKTHHAGRLRTARLNLNEACRIAGIRDFAVEKTGKQHAHLGPSRVDQLPSLLLKADLDLKGNSQLDPRVVLEELLVRLAIPRTD